MPRARANVNVEGLVPGPADVYLDGVAKYTLVDPSGPAPGDPSGRVLELTTLSGATVGTVTVGPMLVEQIKDLLKLR